jgi:energy-coupling factor transporter ATP-binding protein EcfA2
MLELRSVAYRYAGASRPAIDAIDLRVGRGEIVGLLGPNEGGKSTICLVASGLAPASIGGELSGSVLLDGSPLPREGSSELAGRTALLLTDAASQRSRMAASVLEEIAFGPVNLGLEVADTLARVRWTTAALGIAHLVERQPAELSGGQARLVAIASILAMRAPALVLDEPLGELDADSRDRLVRTLRDLAAEGTAILVAEHDTDFLDALGARVVHVREGRIQ